MIELEVFCYQRDSEGDTAVMGQATRGHTQMADVLLQKKEVCSQ